MSQTSPTFWGSSFHFIFFGLSLNPDSTEFCPINTLEAFGGVSLSHSPLGPFYSTFFINLLCLMQALLSPSLLAHINLNMQPFFFFNTPMLSITRTLESTTTCIPDFWWAFRQRIERQCVKGKRIIPKGNSHCHCCSLMPQSFLVKISLLLPAPQLLLVCTPPHHPNCPFIVLMPNPNSSYFIMRNASNPLSLS